MYYSENALQQLSEGYTAFTVKHATLFERYVALPLKNPRAQEFARHGFARRVNVMARCIVNVFDDIPPERTELPSHDELTDATINIQSFVVNVFGAVDNLAWIWMAENGQKRTDGTRIPNSQVGLGPDNIAVRGTLSQEFQKYLK